MGLERQQNAITGGTVPLSWLEDLLFEQAAELLSASP